MMEASRREAMATGGAAAAALIGRPLQAGISSQRHAFAFQTGAWNVSHRKLTARLAGSTDWIEFGGACHAWETLAGGGNVEDHFIDDPRGSYRAGAYRMLDPAADTWSIWWFDPRSPKLSPPVVGRFDGNEGRVFCDDSLGGRAIRVRFTWRIIDSDHLDWRQAFSSDGEKTWETNWTMAFVRSRA